MPSKDSGARIMVKTLPDGRPACPCMICMGFDEPMVEVEPDVWQCPITAEMMRNAAAELGRVAERAQASFEADFGAP